MTYFREHKKTNYHCFGSKEATRTLSEPSQVFLCSFFIPFIGMVMFGGIALYIRRSFVAF
jgi:hypothetical protein